MQTKTQSTRFFIFLAFFSHSIMFSTWFFNVPAVTQRLDLHNDQLGLALFFIPIGSLLGSYLGSVFKIGSRQKLLLLTFVFNVCFTMCALLPIVSNTFLMLCTALFFLGFSSAFLNIAMNSLALRYETSFNLRIVGKCHAVYSIGALFNLTTASLLGASDLNLGIYIICLIAVIISFQFYCLLRERDHLLLSSNGHAEKQSRGQFKLLFLPILFIALITMLIEDALSNWSSLFLIRDHSFSASSAATGLLLFNSFMLLGRLSVDSLSKILPTDKMVTYALILVTVGLGVLVSGIAYVLLSFALVGLGCSIIVPTLYRHFNAISRDGAAILTGAGSAAFLISPLIMGYVSEYFSLRMSFMVILALFGIGLVTSKLFFKSFTPTPK